QDALANANVLGKAAHFPQDVSKHFIAWLEPRDILANRLNSACYIGAEDMMPWFAKTAYAGIQRLAYQPLPVGSVQGYRRELDQYFVVLGGGFWHLFDVKVFGWSVLCVNNR